MNSGAFPWPVLVLNIVGSVFLGVIMAEEWAHPSARLMLHDAGGIGFCGGLTTFSTFSLEFVELLSDGQTVIALAYGVTTVLGGIAGVVVGAAALRQVRALSRPLEERP